MKRSKGGMMKRDLTREMSFLRSDRVTGDTTDAEKQDIAFDEYLNNYWAYKPLSNLPTPPFTASSRASTSPVLALQDPDAGAALDGGSDLDPRYRGAAIHLVNLIPCAASLADPSIPLVQRMLARSGLSLDTIALAVCILDALPVRFSRTWRLTCPLTRFPQTSKRHTLPSAPVSSAAFPDCGPSSSSSSANHQHHASSPQALNIDSVPNEVIILAALVIAQKFTLDQAAEPSSYYVDVWGDGLWEVEQFNATERCMMQCLGYRILPLCAEALLSDAKEGMELAERWHDREQRRISRRVPSDMLTPPASGPASDDEKEPARAKRVQTQAARLGHHRAKTMASDLSGLILP